MDGRGDFMMHLAGVFLCLFYRLVFLWGGFFAFFAKGAGYIKRASKASMVF